MVIADLVRKSRSIRRFVEDVPIDRNKLCELVELARLSPSGRNAQPLKFYISNQPEKNALIFETLAWAGYLKDWGGPKQGERPSAYIIILGDTQISGSFGVDHGIAAQSILLGAVELGFGGCIIATIQRAQLAEALHLPARYEILLVLALGQPAEEVVIEPLGSDGDIRYWRDDQSVHHVPKRSLEELILE